MYFISHRGNLTHRVPELENSPGYIQEALDKGYNVEVDVWCVDNKMFLGHDEPQYEVNNNFFFKKGLWCHAKNIEAVTMLNKLNAHYFWHQKDDITLTSKRYMWTYPGVELTSSSICVMPENANYTLDELIQSAGICSDKIEKYQKEVNNEQ